MAGTDDNRSPAWRRGFDAVERTVGGPLERGITSAEFARATAILRGIRRGVGRTIDGGTSRVLHLMSLPAHSDIRALQRQLVRIEQGIGLVQRELDARENPGRNDGAGRRKDGST